MHADKDPGTLDTVEQALVVGFAGLQWMGFLEWKDAKDSLP